jgi:hypothetical protein
MVELNFDVDPALISDRSFSPIAAGEYNGEIVAADMRTSGAGNQYLSVQVRIEGKGSVWDNLNLRHPNPATVEIAERRLTEIGMALGLAKIADTEQLLARPVRVVVGMQKSDPNRNDIKAYLSREATPAAPAVPPSAPAPAPTAAASATPAWRS